MTYTPWDICSSCGFAMDQAQSMEGRVAGKPGNLSLCLNCGHPTIFREDGHRREIDPKEIPAFPDHVKEAMFRAPRVCSRARGVDLTFRQKNLAH